ncbi:Transcription factor [Schizosaccharomyces pombe]
MDLHSILQPISTPSASVVTAPLPATIALPSPNYYYPPVAQGHYPVNNMWSLPSNVRVISSHGAPGHQTSASQPSTVMPALETNASNAQYYPAYSVINGNNSVQVASPAYTVSHSPHSFSNPRYVAVPQKSTSPNQVCSYCEPLPNHLTKTKSCSIPPILNSSDRSPLSLPTPYPVQYSTQPVSLPQPIAAPAPPSAESSKSTISDEDVAWQLIRLGASSSNSVKSSPSKSFVSISSPVQSTVKPTKASGVVKSEKVEKRSLPPQDFGNASSSTSAKRRRPDHNHTSTLDASSSNTSLASTGPMTVSSSTVERKGKEASEVNPNSTSSVTFSDFAAAISRSRCSRCKKSKKGCDRQRPCGRCRDAGLNSEDCISDDDMPVSNARKPRGRGRGRPKTKN